MRRLVVLFLALATPACGPRSALLNAETPAARLVRLWPEIAGGQVADRITDPMVSIRHDQAPSPHFRASWIGVALDGNVLYARRLDRTRPPERDLSVFDGRVRPGRHVFGVYLQLDHAADEQISREPSDRVAVDTLREFMLAEGQFATITTRTREYDPALPPSLDVEFQFRPIRSD